MSLPPPPCAMRTCGYCWMDSGQLALKSGLDCIGCQIQKTNIEHRTLNIELRMSEAVATFDVGRSMLGVRCFAIFICSFCRNRPAIAVVSRARAFARNHRRAERMFRRAARAERRALVRLLQALQNQARDADRKSTRLNSSHANISYA